MPEYLAPGVYVEEVPRGPRPIEGVATSTAGFVGATVHQPLMDRDAAHPAAPVLVTSFTEFVQAFGDASPVSAPPIHHLTHAIRLFFDNGGQRCFVVHVAGTSAADRSPTTDDFIGSDDGPGVRTGIHALEDIPEVLIIAAPGCSDVRVQGALIAQCERRPDRFALLDCEPASARPAGIDPIAAHRGDHDTSFAAYYTPWLIVSLSGRAVPVPPSGAVAGVIARVDRARGVWKAPANEDVHGVIGLDTAFADADQSVLNPVGINVIRSFEGRGIRIWGARTLAHDSEWKHVNVRRFLMFLELSIERGTRWLVFEPNVATTWKSLVAQVQDFLIGLWRQGALQGRTPQEALFVRCDHSTMAQNDLDSGRLICEIGVAVVRPAEFVIFRIGQWTACAK